MEDDFFFQDFNAPPNIDDFDDGSITMKVVLNDPMTFKAIRSSNYSIVLYFANHIQELLDFALHEPYNSLSSKAFAILEIFQPQISAAMLNSSFFPNIASEILYSIIVDSVSLGRISSLVLSSLMHDPYYVMNNCGFILQLLQYLNEPNVFSLFQFMCSQDERMLGIQNWLIDIGFHQLILKEIESFQCLSFSRANPEANLISAYFSIISISAQSSVLFYSFVTEEFVSALNRNIGEYPAFVEDSRWIALVSLFNSIQDQRLKVSPELIKNGIDVLHDDRVQTLGGVAVVKLLTLFLEKYISIRPLLTSAGLSETMISLVNQFPQHTELLLAVKQFIFVSFGIREMFHDSLIHSIPMIIEAISKSEVCRRALALEIANEISRLSESDKRMAEIIKQFPEYSKIDVHRKRYNTIRLLPYGKNIEHPIRRANSRPLISRKFYGNFNEY